MLAGVGAVDACLFVVAATEGWKPQSEEHLRILELLGVRHGLVALTKVDLVDDRSWSSWRRSTSPSRSPARSSPARPIVPVAAPTGDGPRRPARGARPAWPRARRPPRDRGRPRLWIDRAFAAEGSGTVVTGTLTGGPLARSTARRRAGWSAGARPRHADARAIGRLDRARAPRGPQPGRRRPRGGAAGRRRGDAGPVALDGAWSTPSLSVLPSLDHEVSRRGAYLAYVGSGEHAVRAAGARRRVRAPGCDRPRAAPPAGRAAAAARRPVRAPGDRSRRDRRGRRGARRRAGASRRRGPAPTATSTGSWPSGGGSTADELERLTGERRGRRPSVGGSSSDAALRGVRGGDLADRVDEAGPLGVDLAALDERQRAALATLDDLAVDADDGPAGRSAPTRSPTTRSLAALAAGGLAPPIRRRASTGPSCGSWSDAGWSSSGTGCGSTPTPSRRRRRLVAGLLAAEPDGFTVELVPRGGRDHPQARRAAAGRARRPGRHPPPRRRPHRRPEAAPT